MDLLRIEEMEAVASRMGQLGSKLLQSGAASAAVEPLQVSWLAARALLRRCSRLQVEPQVTFALCRRLMSDLQHSEGVHGFNPVQCQVCMQVIERQARSVSVRAATLAGAMQHTGAISDARQTLADTAAELMKHGVRGQSLQTALVPLVESDLPLSARIRCGTAVGSRSDAVTDINGCFWRRDGRPADNSFLEACAGALAVLLREGSDAVRDIAAR